MPSAARKRKRGEGEEDNSLGRGRDKGGMGELLPSTCGRSGGGH